MNRATWGLLFGVISMSITLLVGFSLYSDVYQEVKCMNLISDLTRERMDIIVSDRVPMGCFIPPDISEGEFNTLKDDIKNSNKILWNHCFNLGDDNTVNWSLIGDKLKNGIKLNGYCYDCEQPYCLCLKENLTNGLSSRRSINFVQGNQYQNCTHKSKSPFSNIAEVPSVIVAKTGAPISLSLYGGIKLTGKKRLVGAKGALYKGNTRISEYTDPDRFCTSCFYGDSSDPTTNFGCYYDCYDDEMCEEHCSCHTDKRCYNESAVNMCKNYCKLTYHATLSDMADCNSGCIWGNNRYEYRDCYSKTGQKEGCGIGRDCDGDGVKDDDDCEIYLEEPLCSDLDSKVEKEGCNKFQEFQNSVFEIGPMNYTIFKIGDLNINNRGLANAVVNLTVQGEFHGASCYNIDNYECYFDCCEEICAKHNCENNKCNEIEDSSSTSICEERCDCSTISRVERNDPFVLCRTFCASRDAFLDDVTKMRNCQKGCEWAARQYNKPEFITSQKTVDLVFVTDTSGSMDDEWDTLCDIIDDIISDVEEEDYKLNVTTYGLDTGSCVNKNYYCADDEILSNSESWGPGAEWAVKNHPWREDILSKILFVVGDEGPYKGDSINDNDKDSVDAAVQVAKENNVTIFGLWGTKWSGEIDDDLKDLFYNISEPTGGNASLFSSPSDVTKIISDAIIRGEEFDVGYYKYEDLRKNVVPTEDPYIFRDLYHNVYSNLVYIVNWEGAGWRYPHSSEGWTKIETPSGYLNKTIGLNTALSIIKDNI